VVIICFLAVFSFKRGAIFYYQHWLELVWTIVPIFVLSALALPSFFSLYFRDDRIRIGKRIVVKGFQWYWEYESSVFNTKYTLGRHIIDGENRLLEVDFGASINPLYLKKFEIFSNDVIHSFAIPSLGVKVDAVPGLANSITVDISKDGLYYGQCSELCGVNHSLIPIVLIVYTEVEPIFVTETLTCSHCEGKGTYIIEKIIFPNY